MESKCKHLDLQIWSMQNKADFKPSPCHSLLLAWLEFGIVYCSCNNIVELWLSCLLSQTILMQGPWKFLVTAPGGTSPCASTCEYSEWGHTCFQLVNLTPNSSRGRWGLGCSPVNVTCGCCRRQHLVCGGTCCQLYLFSLCDSTGLQNTCSACWLNLQMGKK